ncbi:MAG TPA: peptidoglycan bridge formation glycyltransferase FemA/FemB family protein [Candidatus Saccharimonadales bacterium]
MIQEITDQEIWNRLIEENGGHPLQLWGWGEVKLRHGWQARRFALDDNLRVGAQVLLRRLPKGIGAFAYIPRGPVGEWSQAMLDELSLILKKQFKAIVLSVEPDQEEMTTLQGWKKAKNTVLLAQTLKLDLEKSEEELLANISSKRRYDIRSSTKKIAAFRQLTSSEDLEKCLALYKHTAKRAGFALHGDDYYHDIHVQLGEHSVILGAWDEQGNLLAFTWFAVSPKVAFELYSGISDKGQKLRINYGLKWWCIQEMKRRGVKQYDFNGLLNDGISTFKRSFASHETTLVGTYDKPLSPLYSVWSEGLPLAKKVVRTLKKR